MKVCPWKSLASEEIATIATINITILPKFLIVFENKTL
jgi:hypothetical protein